MNRRFSSLLGTVIVPRTVEIISRKENIDEIQAVREFYSSGTYEILSNEESWVWHFSPLMLYSMWKGEKETGVLEFPEET